MNTNSSSLSRTPGKVAKVAVLQLLVLALLVAAAVPAAASPSVVRIAATSPLDGDPSKSATAGCPNGMRLVGAGGAVNRGDPDVRIYQITPNVGLTGLTVRALASADPSWSVTAYGVCTSISLPGLERQTFISGADSDVFKSATASCSPGKRVLGTGGLVSGGVSNVLIDDILPHAALDQVTVWGVEGQGGNPDNWTVTAVAICASVSELELSRVMAGSLYDSDSVKGATATCPNGTVLFGTGAELLNGGGQVKIDDIAPNGSLSTSPTSNRVVAMEDADGTAEDWQVKAYAICYALPVP